MVQELSVTQLLLSVSAFTFVVKCCILLDFLHFSHIESYFNYHYVESATTEPIEQDVFSILFKVTVIVAFYLF